MHSPALPLLVAALALVAGACGGSSNNDRIPTVFDTSYAVSGMTPIALREKLAVFLANEDASGGMDLNGDMDTDDDVAVQLHMPKRREVLLGVAARRAAIVGGEIYLVVDEADDGMDWGGAAGLGDLVLLHYSGNTELVTFVDVLDPRSEVILSFELEDGLLYASNDSTPVDGTTSLRILRRGDPTLPLPVANEAGGGYVRPLLLCEEEGLIFLSVDENDQGVDRNGDMDATDEHVLAVWNVERNNASIQNTGAAMPALDAPVAALRGGGDWVAACLISEAAQGDTNLNDPALFSAPLVPASCADDDDTEDDVLHYFRYDELDAGAADFLVNTGLAGRDRIVVLEGAVATLSDEDAADCDLNEDMDTADTMVRWVVTEQPIAPPSDPAQLLAVETLLPGGSMGLVGLDEFIVCVVDEEQDGRNHDGKSADHDLVSWLEPGAGPAVRWTFAHQRAGKEMIGTGVFDSAGTSEPYAGVSWMAHESEQERIGIAYQEEVPGTNPLISSLNNNIDCDVYDKDMDLVDVLPVWADFEEGPTFDLDGTGFALVPDNAGIRVVRGVAFFRVDEMRDSFDYNGDGDMSDLVIVRNPVATCMPRYVAESTPVVGPVIESDGREGAVLLSSEIFAGEDINGDGDLDDFVLRYFAF